MTPLQIIALAFVVFAFLKIIIILKDPQAWISFVKALYSKPLLVSLISLVVAGIILKCLLQELTIIQIFASMTFMMAMMMVQFAAFSQEIIELSDKFLKDRAVMRKAWLSLSVWIVLMVWVIIEVFA
ncbi:MAG: hypothetical protein KKD07_09340 [Candidatus Omnitrophica bacterium]|nr:hypothetical protein [Candidatus Omnitrophota bacterium]MBU1997254.1 hypothetical protein [Candidatus Omnitrophota bacterium]MBU4334630.1 hypothetical protein [Candidatus Omnitrophota bacterium]